MTDQHEPLEAPTIGVYEIDPALAGLVQEELARVPARRRAAADVAIRAHLASNFVGTHAQHVTKWCEVIRPFQQLQRRAADDIELKGLSDALASVSLKSAGQIEIKDAAEGKVAAIVSTLNVVDRDGDVVLTGAIKDGAVVKLSSYGHDIITEDKAPVGLGTVTIDGDKAIMIGQYFLSTTRGRDAFETIKALGPNSEWSISYKKNVREAPMTAEWRAKGARRLIAAMDVMEASPVFLGANGLTQTLATKDADGDATESPTTEVTPPAEVIPPAGEPDAAAVAATATATAAALAAEAEAAETARAATAQAETAAAAARIADALETKQLERSAAARREEFERFTHNMRRFGKGTAS